MKIFKRDNNQEISFILASTNKEQQTMFFVLIQMPWALLYGNIMLQS